MQSAKTKIIPFVIIFNITYNSYTVFLLTESDPGIFGCIPTGGKPELVSEDNLMCSLLSDKSFVPFTKIC